MELHFFQKIGLSVLLASILFGVFNLAYTNNVDAAFSSSATIGGCTFTSYITDNNDKKITGIAPNTPFKVVVEWAAGFNTKCADYEYVEIGWYSAPSGVSPVYYPQYCNQQYTLVGSKRVVKVSFNTSTDAAIMKYVHPVGNSIILCSEGEKKSISSNQVMRLSASVDNSKKPGTTNSNSSTGTTNSGTTNTSSTPEKDTGPVENPDTSVQVNVGQSLDTIIGTFYNPLEFTRPEQLVVRLINALLLLAGIISVIMIIVGGLRMVASGGSEGQIKRGKQTVIWAVGGLLVSLMAFTIVAIIQSIIS